MIRDRYFAIVFYWVLSIDRRLLVNLTAFVHKGFAFDYTRF